MTITGRSHRRRRTCRSQLTLHSRRILRNRRRTLRSHLTLPNRRRTLRSHLTLPNRRTHPNRRRTLHSQGISRSQAIVLNQGIIHSQGISLSRRIITIHLPPATTPARYTTPPLESTPKPMRTTLSQYAKAPSSLFLRIPVMKTRHSLSHQAAAFFIPSSLFSIQDLNFLNKNPILQHWYKDFRWANQVKDEEGLPGFALVNKVTGLAIKHSLGPKHPVRLIPFNPEFMDESILWTESHDTGEGYRCIRMVNNIRLNFDAFHGDKDHGGVHDGTTVVLWEWLKGKNQRWKIVPYYCKFPHFFHVSDQLLGSSVLALISSAFLFWFCREERYHCLLSVSELNIPISFVSREKLLLLAEVL
ncbi:hypothetical protein KFK09_000931 [Dendrobium nobile]|uniref:Uncharacterized protein n=1 Tax=Dendrobium nobile TaxID=94219 RepID=A0A8T3CEG6_DENNO|nr:hypothetical protein KFK09_000931 [Dendrobium nobile]